MTPSGEQAGPAGGDPVADIFGAPDTAFEFDTSSLTGLTAIGTPDVVDADTTVPGCYYIQDNATGTALCGHFVGSLTPPFTVIGKLMDSTVRADYMTAGIFVGVADPTSGKLDTIAHQYSGGHKLVHTLYNNPTSANTTPWFAAIDIGVTGFYFAIVVNSSTDIDMLYSRSGRMWSKVVDAYNPGAPIASANVFIMTYNANNLAITFDFLRIWNSAKTFPGA